MLVKNKKRALAATEKHLFFADGGDPGRLDGNAGWVSLPLAQFLSEECDPTMMTAFGEPRAPLLLVIPDHWVKHDFFLFKSQKESLIRPFIERKLKTAHPGLPSAQDFFSYGCRQKTLEGPGVRVFHLSEPTAFELYAALSRNHLTPRWITTPALLWEERFNRQVPEFEGQAALVIHLQRHEGFLYFYHQGDFLFSREVTLPQSSERIDALLFEINQSIYLFSQKAKSDLQAVYLIGDEAGFRERLSDLLGRPVQTAPGISAGKGVPRELSALDGLLDPDAVLTPAEAHCITHRRIQQQVKWRPVQWAGMLVAGALLAGFAVEHHWLEERVAEEMVVRNRMRQQQAMSLADYDAAVVELTDDLSRPSPAHLIFNVVASLPEGASVLELKVDAEAAHLDLAAIVRAESIERFRQQLRILIDNLNRRLRPENPITMEDVVFSMQEAKRQVARTDYKITCKIRLT